MRATTRRRLLSGVLGGGLAIFGGCLGASGGDGAAARLGYVRMANWHDEPHTLHVLVERDGEPVHWTSYALESASDGVRTATLEQDWTGTPGEYVVYVRRDGRTSWKEFEAGEGTGDCFGVEARVNEAGELGIWYEQKPAECESAAGDPTDAA